MTNNSTTRQIQKYDFHGDTLDVIPDGDRLHIGIRAVCEALGVDVSRQLKKLKAKPWACVDMKATQIEGDDQTRQIATIDLRSLPMWLATIEPSRCRADVREKLALYQVECAAVLAAHFLPRVMPQPDAPPLLAQFVETLQAMRGQIEALSAEVATLRAAGQGRTCLGNGAARLHVLDPLKQIAAIEARAIGKTDDRALRRMRKLAEDTLRERLAYPRDGGQAWAMFPTARLGDLHCALVRMMHDARKRADIAAPRPMQGSFFLNDAAGATVALAKPN